MSRAQTEATSRVCDVYRTFKLVLDLLGSHTQLDASAVENFSSAHELLAALPLATDDYGRALLRLENAIHYLRSHEPGAASYELRMLAGGLRMLLESSGAVRPSRRLRTVD